MNKIVGAALGLGAVAAVGMLRRGRGSTDNRAAKVYGGTEDGSLPGEGHKAELDPLGEAHQLPAAEAKYVRAAQRHVRGKNTSREREAMFDDLRGVGEAGSMGGKHGREDQNAIGPNG